jgi:mono/diheme cytochrome c family protein
VESRNRLALVIGCSCLAIVTSGCSDAINAGPLQYVEAPALTQDLGPTQGNLKDKPKLQEKVHKALEDLYGPDPQHIRIPQGMPLTIGGIYLANYQVVGEGDGAKTKPIFQGERLEDATPQAGGYAIYRRNCVHCHGVSGAGDGPTAPFLYPVPRDYRPGKFKFTSTTSGKPPHRDDLRRTITYGLHGTSMPAFEPLLTESEIEQAIDYVMFLSMRGQTELGLIDEGSTLGDNEADLLDNETVQKVANRVFKAWRDAQSDMMNPKVARTPPTRESILRGRDLFLSSDCKDCHGRQGVGDGDNFLDMDVFNKIVFDGNPSERPKRAEELIEKDSKKLWKDDWGNPLRPANLNRGIYKGGRRPIDLYWRIAKGINGAQMPAHYPSPFDDQKMWDIVNFILALPYEPELLTEAPPPPPAGGTAVAAAGGK